MLCPKILQAIRTGKGTLLVIEKALESEVIKTTTLSAALRSRSLCGGRYRSINSIHLFGLSRIVSGLWHNLRGLPLRLILYSRGKWCRIIGFFLLIVFTPHKIWPSFLPMLTVSENPLYFRDSTAVLENGPKNRCNNNLLPRFYCIFEVSSNDVFKIKW